MVWTYQERDRHDRCAEKSKVGNKWAANVCAVECRYDATALLEQDPSGDPEASERNRDWRVLSVWRDGVAQEHRNGGESNAQEWCNRK
jgi:hypothetical protein